MLPGADPEIDLRATVFRPGKYERTQCDSDGTKRPLVVINHGTDVSTSRSVSIPVFYWLSRWFVERGWIVVLPQRRGHGATGGKLVEAQDSCARPDHFAAGQKAADDVAAVVNFMARQPFVDADKIVVAGVSTGGWASLALASRTGTKVRAVINFAGGRGAYAWGRPYEICDAEQLAVAAGRFGEQTKVPSLWLYSENDSYFPPDIAKAMAAAYKARGGSAEFHLLPSYGSEGHSLADDHAGWSLWGDNLSSFLNETLTGQHIAKTGRAIEATLVSAGPSQK